MGQRGGMGTVHGRRAGCLLGLLTAACMPVSNLTGAEARVGHGGWPLGMSARSQLALRRTRDDNMKLYGVQHSLCQWKRRRIKIRRMVFQCAAAQRSRPCLTDVEAPRGLAPPLAESDRLDRRSVKGPSGGPLPRTAVDLVDLDHDAGGHPKAPVTAPWGNGLEPGARSGCLGPRPAWLFFLSRRTLYLILHQATMRMGGKLVCGSAEGRLGLSPGRRVLLVCYRHGSRTDAVDRWVQPTNLDTSMRAWV
ncbi:hypothetical protein F4780DRAFT_577124 [Xylariomycetidae sp. FL0641]|nr:hypothetical protein F4780DRAFT_577124 [Xylariomycetidae sp. FL0641]